MSRNSRRIAGHYNDAQFKPKRMCNAQRRSNIVECEEVLWSETDESFFSNTNLDVLFTGTQEMCNTQRSVFKNCKNDDSIFNTIDLPEKSDNVDKTTITQVFGMNDIESNDTFFSDINMNDLHNLDEQTYESNNNIVQNTQTFLEDVALTIPKAPDPKQQTLLGDSFISVSLIENIVRGTQYHKREEIKQNGTLVDSPVSTFQNSESQAMNGADAETDCLSFFNLETQAFPEEHKFPSKGSFYGLPDKVKNLIFEHKGINCLYDWQNECLNLPAINKRNNLIYALPTSGGKTLVAEIVMLREIICRQRNVLFILPYVSIVQEKVSAMSPFAIALDFIVDEYTAGKGKCPPVKRRKRNSIFIASIEKGAVLIDSLIEAERANEIGLVVVDELHLIGEKGRGATLEALLTKIIFLNANIQIVGMSATIGNLSEISAFLNADVYTRGFRPVELKEYIKVGKDILEINTAGKSIDEVFVFRRSVNYKYSEAVLRTDPDHLAGLVTECAPENCCLIFCSSRKNCENVALLLSRILPKSKFLEHKKNEKQDLMDALQQICGILSPVLAKTIPYGIAYHHSGLTTDERKFIETAFRIGVLSVICCTSTLAAGVNLPAKRVIIRAPYVGTDFLTLCRYKQMVGRAGRAGMGEAGESILITSSRDNVRVGEMLFSPMDKAISSLDYQDSIGLQALILSAIGLGLANCRKDLYRLINSTLLAVQSTMLNISPEGLVLNIIREMFQSKVLEIKANDNTSYADIITTQDMKHNGTQDIKENGNCATQSSKGRRLMISKSTRFQLTTIGKAAFKAGIDYKRAFAIYKELQLAQTQMILTNYAHLLYLVVSFNSNGKGDELFAADAGILFRMYNDLDADTQKLFQLLGFTEAHAVKIGKTLSIAGTMELKSNRLFKVLILLDILNLMPLPTISEKFNIERGMLQNLISQSTSSASAIVRLCEEIEEFWCFKPLFERISRKMDRCGTMELEPLLNLPAVKINRAKQFYTAGYKTIEDIAKCKPMELIQSVQHLSYKVAKEIISAAKIILMKKLDDLEEETEILKACLNQNPE